MTPHQTNDPKPSDNADAQEAELVEKLPDKTDPAQERGERLATGKAIAMGGSNQPRPGEEGSKD